MMLVIEKDALRGMLKMPAKLRTAMMAKLKAIAASPFAVHPFDVKAMKGEQDVFRLRQGDWRAIYRVVRVEDTVRVRIVDVRGNMYE